MTETAASHGAQGQYLGYSYQLSRLLSLLIAGRLNERVVLEHLGDVAVASPEGISMVEEDKNRTSSSNPISNRAVDLWKTLANWLAQIETGLDPVLAEFHLHTNRKFTADWAQRFEDLRDVSAADALVQEIANSFKESPPSEGIRQHVETVLDQDRRSNLCNLLVSFRLSTGSGDSRQDQLDLLRRTVVPEEHLEDVLSHMVGWVKGETDGKLERGEVAAVSVKDAHRELQSITRKLDRQTILRSFAPIPTDTEVTSAVGRTFVRQLQLINEPDINQYRAVRQFLRARSDRIHWAEKALVNVTEFTELEEALTGVWDNRRTLTELRDGAKTEIDRGRILFHECMEYQCRVRGMDTPPHFTAGSFHALADSLFVGWHPRYKEHLDIGPEGGE